LKQKLKIDFIKCRKYEFVNHVKLDFLAFSKFFEFSLLDFTFCRKAPAYFLTTFFTNLIGSNKKNEYDLEMYFALHDRIPKSKSGQNSH